MGNHSVWSSLIILLSVFLCFFSTRSATVENYDYPYLWDQVPGSIEDLPVKDDQIIMDPWDYRDRLSMYKLMINHSAKYFTQFGINNTGNVFWALATFYGKLYVTGRCDNPSNDLVNNSPEKENFVLTKSGWSGISYYVAIPFFLSALKLNFFGPLPYQIELLPQEERRSDFCYSFDECNASYPQMMAIDLKIFEYLQSREKTSNNAENPTYNTDMETIIHYTWSGHQAGVDVGKPLFYDKSQFYSAGEKDFAESFLTTIEFLEAANYPSDFKNASDILLGFPHRRLTTGDWLIPGWDFDKYEKVLLTAVKLISGINSISGGAFLNIWKTIMMSETARKDAPVLIKIMFDFPEFIPLDIN
ncbi:protein LEG1 homolog [Trichosurus vulpecula]|uniref:protein LEG1 homolog n=1 Tax=Trichosurus vulpecula TaxID=9337 RepID=UPI00186B21D3|nr:protein LEG1 homolog [Trichosurus vulpecula]